MEQLRIGSRDTAGVLCERYRPHILPMVRRKLDKKLRSEFDSADFEQVVWTFFFVDLSHRDRFERPEESIAFLAELAHNRLVDMLRQRYRTVRYNINRERSLDGSAAHQARQVVARQPTPTEFAVADERWDQLLGGQPPHSRRILELLRQGRRTRKSGRNWT